MQLDQANSSVSETNSGNSLHFPPNSSAIRFLQATKISNSRPFCHCFDVIDFINYIKMHWIYPYGLISS